MLDRFNRHINYLRISLTDRCNLRCRYCIPPDASFMATDTLMDKKEIAKVVAVAAKVGINKIRFTGGEPLVRSDIVELTRTVASCPGIHEVGATTNGILLSKYASQLKQAGLNRVNISLDTLDPEKFAFLTQGGRLDDVLNGIREALKHGLTPVKINFVRSEDNDLSDEIAIKQFCSENGFHLQTIRQMNLKAGKFFPVENGKGGVCHRCNRLRITADGRIKPCLHSDHSFSIREYGIEEAFLKALGEKPLRGTGTSLHEFYNIGG